MTRDITGTNSQGSRSGPRADQAPHQPVRPEDLVLDLADGEAELAADQEDGQEPVSDIDALGAAVKGDSERPVDKSEAPKRVHDNPSRTL